MSASVWITGWPFWFATGALPGLNGACFGIGASLAFDLPPGPLIVCTLTLLGIAVFLSFRPRIPS